MKKTEFIVSDLYPYGINLIKGRVALSSHVIQMGKHSFTQVPLYL